MTIPVSRVKFQLRWKVEIFQPKQFSIRIQCGVLTEASINWFRLLYQYPSKQLAELEYEAKQSYRVQVSNFLQLSFDLSNKLLQELQKKINREFIRLVCLRFITDIIGALGKKYLELKLPPPRLFALGAAY